MRARALLLGLALAAAGCAPIRLALPVRVRVVDEETRAPVAGALVELAASTHCTAFVDTVTKQLQAVDAEGDRGGRVLVGGGVDLLFPLCMGWETRLAAVAPGYAVAGGSEVFRFGMDGEPDQRIEFD
jgi:hypothetical protein